MSHLIAVSVGPVQELIAAARRTRDLWFGSHLLSEISRSVAKAIEDRGGVPIFPASTDAENVANVILAELPEGDPRSAATAAKDAGQGRWLEFAEEVRREAREAIREEIWEDQVSDVPEFFAAWVASTGDYRSDRRELARLLAGRKNCRDFRPARGRAGVSKSSLDGQRESALRPRSEWRSGIRSRLRIREGEQLDAVGLVKRLAGGSRGYPSVARIAADPWVRGCAARLEPAREACRGLGTDVIRGIDFEQYRDFPYEGTAVYLSRHHELMEETGATPEDLKPLRDALARLPAPDPYLAVLVADGDRMGAAISRLDSAEANREFSRSLADFAMGARGIVERHKGVAVYAGGDDVLAFLPVDRCLDCARELHEDFGKKMARYEGATLSAGIALGHFMENLEDLLEYGRAAEKSAKRPDRNGLAVHLHKRGGAPIVVRSRWEEEPDRRLTRFAEWLNAGEIPTRLPYELRAMARLYESWGEDAVSAIAGDLRRLIARKSSRGSGEVAERLSGELGEMSSEGLSRLSRELLVARQIATGLRQASGGAGR